MVPIADFKPHLADINTVDSSFKIKELILSSSSDGTIKAINILSKQVVGGINLGKPVNMATWHPVEYVYDIRQNICGCTCNDG